MTIWQDLKYAARMLRARLGFAFAAIMSLALGIGASTIIFSIVDGVLLRPLPYSEPARIVQIKEVSERRSQMPVTQPNFEDVRNGNHTLDALAAYGGGEMTVTGGAEPVRASTYAVSEDFFNVFGVQPVVGRVFAADDKSGDVAVVSYGFWQRLLGARNDLSSARLNIFDQSFTVIGVMPAGFQYPKDAEVWIPSSVYPPNTSRSAHNWEVVGRLNVNASLEQAQADVSSIARQFKAQFGNQVDATDMTLIPLREYLVGNTKPVLLVMLAAVGLLLLIACANVANMLLAQATARYKEFAVRRALGASRRRLAQQFVTESALLALAAGVVGVLLAFWGVDALLSLNQVALPRAGEISVNAKALGFTLALAFAVAIIVGLVPVLRLSGTDLHTGLKEAGRGSLAHAATNRLRSALVVAQIALTLILLVGAGLLGKSFLRVLQIDPGFRADNTVAMDISLQSTKPEQVAQFHERLLERINRIPGVAVAGGVDLMPMTGGLSNGQFLIVNTADPTEAELHDIKYYIALAQNPQVRKGSAEYRVASADYFAVMGIPLVSGRAFDQTDTANSPHVAIISQSLARQYFADEDAIGKRIQFGNMDGDLHTLHVVGVVGDVREYGLTKDVRPMVYVNYAQRPRRANDFTIVARSSAAPASLIPEMRSAVEALSRDVPMKFRTVAQIFSSSLAERRFNLVIIGVFAVVALLLAVTGIYGVMSYVVTQRTQEIGIRMALGATVTDILKLTLARGFRLVATGLVVGLAGAVALTRLLATLLFDISATDPLTFAAVAIVLAAVALVACYIPARRATKVDPMIALRYE
ncbi:MAG: ABC transporter permease [Blastocatellia bacterium]